MSTATFHEPLRAVPPTDQMKQKFSALLAARHAASRAFDAIMAAPRKAAGFVGRLMHALHLSRPLRWVANGRSRLVRYAVWAGQRLGRLGVASAVGSIVTHPHGQAVIRTVGRFLGRAVSWAARSMYKAVDAGLRLFGRPGNRVADGLFDLAVRVGGPLGRAASGVVHRVARLTDPEAAHMRLLGGLSRSYSLHRVSRLVVRNRWVRALLDGALIPVLADSRIWDWLKRLFREAAARVSSLRNQRRTVTVIREVPTEVVEPVVFSAADDSSDAPEDLEIPVPGNRAERRAMQREQARLRHHPTTA